MSFFSIETFYFLSMGIVGILIIMLIFHFRNKIVLLEKQVQGLHSIASELVNDVRRVHVAQPFGLGGAAAGLENFLARPSFSEDDDEEVPPLVIGSEPADIGPVVEEPVFEPDGLKTVRFDLPSEQQQQNYFEQPQFEPVQEIALQEVVSVEPEISVEPVQEIALQEAVSVEPEISVEPVQEIALQEAVSVEPEISVEPVQEIALQEVVEDDDKTVATTTTIEGASLPLKKRHVSELRSMALSAGIEGAAKMKKAELVALLSAAPQEPVHDVPEEVLV
jgi:hypothetical protein